MGMTTNKVFISYSGVTSKNVDLELRAAFENASNGQVKCFIAPEDLSSGEQWVTRLQTELDECSLFVLSLTKENINSPWLTYEAGMASAKGKSVLPLLINCEFEDLRGSPLRSYQGIKLSEDASRRKLALEAVRFFDFDRNVEESFSSAFLAQLCGVREKSNDAKYHHYITTLEEYIQAVSSIDITTNGKSKKGIQPSGECFLSWANKQSKGETIIFDPMPSVFRTSKYSEQEIYNQIMTECAHEFAGCMNHCETLAKMQHYGTPTRLLDITTNALAALFFACVDESGKTNNRSEGGGGLCYSVRR